MDDELTPANLERLADYFRQSVLDEQQVVIVCDLLASIELSVVNDKSDILRAIRSYFMSCVAFDMAILNQLAVGGFFNIQDDNLQTPLHWILANSRLVLSADHIKAIISRGGDPTITDINGDSPLHTAVVENLDSGIVAALLEGQPKPSPLLTQRNKTRWTPMRILASHHDSMKVGTLRVLEKFGGDINETDKDGNSLLHIVFSSAVDREIIQDPKFGDIAKTFVELGADVNIKNNLNQVPLRLAIELKAALNYVIQLIPSADILNDESCWDGPFIDYVLKNVDEKMSSEDKIFVDTVFDNDAIRVSDKTLSLAVEYTDIEPNQIQTLLAKGCRVNLLEVLNQTIADVKYESLEALLTNPDEELVEMVKVRHPNILVKMSYDCWQDEDITWMQPLITLLLDKYDIDVDYKVSEGGKDEQTLLHNLIRCTDVVADTSTLELVLAVKDLDINQSVKMKLDDELTVEDFSPLKHAICESRFEAAELLIKNFADTTNLPQFRVRCYNGFALCFMLLSVFGYKCDFEKLKKSAYNALVKQEVDYVQNWINERSKKVLSLKELSALQFRRQATKQDLNQLIKDIEIPEDIQDVLFLKCFKSDFEAMEIEEVNERPVYDDMHDNPMEDDDDDVFGFEDDLDDEDEYYFGY